MHLEFVKAAEPLIRQIIHGAVGSWVSEHSIDIVQSESWNILLEKWVNLSHLDLADRGPTAAKDALGPNIELLMKHRSDKFGSAPIDVLAIMDVYSKKAGAAMNEVYDRTRVTFFLHQTTLSYLGSGSKFIY